MVTRRSTLIGLGGLLSGGGALLGTGAFTAVEAERSVSMETAGDANAFLSLEVIDEEYVDVTDGTIEFDVLGDATTQFEDLVDVRNRGTQTVRSLRFEFDVVGADQPDSAVEDALKIISGDATIDAVDETNLLVVSDAGDAENDELAPGEAIPFGIAIDLTDDDIDSIDGDPEITLTIIAETEADDAPDNGDTYTVDIDELADGTGNDIEVTVSVDTDDADAELRIVSFWSEDQPGQEGDIRNETTQDAVGGTHTYTVLGANQNVDRVRVEFIDGNGTVRGSDTMTRSPP